jgi:hypothetical protein
MVDILERQIELIFVVLGMPSSIGTVSTAAVSTNGADGVGVGTASGSMRAFGMVRPWRTSDPAAGLVSGFVPILIAFKNL